MLVIEMRGPVERVYSKIPTTTRGIVKAGHGECWRHVPGHDSGKCPSCGIGICEMWLLKAESPGKVPENGDVFRAVCSLCGYETTGQIVEIEVVRPQRGTPNKSQSTRVD